MSLQTEMSKQGEEEKGAEGVTPGGEENGQKSGMKRRLEEEVNEEETSPTKKLVDLLITTLLR